MDLILCGLPEHILCQLFCDWLTINDISILDCALCCHSISRTYLLRIISESSHAFPINSIGVQFSLSYWLWLINRKIYINALVMEGEGLMLDDLIHNIHILENNTNKNNNEALVMTIMNVKVPLIDCISILNRIESFRLTETYYGQVVTLILNLSSYCTNLKSLTLDTYHFFADTHHNYASSLTAILDANTHCLTELSLINISHNEEIVLTHHPLLLSNINNLKLDKNDTLEDNIWLSISNCLINLTSLSLRLVSVALWRKSSSNLKKLKYLEISFDNDLEEDDDLNGLFPSCLISLDLNWNFKVYEVKQMENLLSFLPLINLKELSINQQNICYPPHLTFSIKIPPTLTSIDCLMRLKMACVNVIDDNTIAEILANNNFSNLKLLNLSNNDNICCEGFLNLLPLSLTSLDVSDCSGVTSTGISKITALTNRNPRLEVLYDYEVWRSIKSNAK
eukprot:gene5804-8010_t